MRASLAGLFVWMAVGLVAAGQEPPAAGKFITLDLVVADLAEGAPAIPTAAAVLELEKAGKLSGLAKYRLTALENQPATMQFGERVPVVTGRASRGGFGGAAGEFGGGGAGGTAIYSQASVGTLITVVASQEPSGDVIANLKFERSSIAARPAEADGAAAAPQGTNTVSVQSTVRAKPGEPLLVGGRQTGGKEAGQTWLVLTASVAAAPKPEVVEPKPAAAAGTEEQFKILSIVNGSAADLATILSTIFQREPVRIAVDARTNSLLLRGSPDTIEVMRNIVLRLDVADGR